MATITADVGGGNWSAGGTWVGGVAPTSADNVLLTLTSGNVNADLGTANSLCRSLDCTGYTGTLTITAGGGNALKIGDATAGASSIALKLVAGMTLTLTNAITSTIWFASTSSTQQTIVTAGKTLARTLFNGVGGSWILSDALTIGSTADLTVSNGIFDSGNQAISAGLFVTTGNTVHTVTLGSSTVTVTGSATTVWDSATTAQTNYTFNANTSIIILNGGAVTATTFSGGAQTYNEVRFTGSGLPAITGANTFATLTRTGTAAKTDYWQLSANQTVTGTVTINGNSATNRVLVQSETLGTGRTITAAVVTVTNADFRDITGAGAGSWNLAAITGNSGDCGGNSGITFTTAATQTATGTASFSWSTHGWTSRVPLPQDDVVISNAFSASQTVTGDMPRLGKNISFTGATGTPTYTSSVSITLYGSLTLISGMTLAVVTQIMYFEGRGSFTLTSAGKNFSNYTMTLQAFGGTYTLQDAFSSTAKTLTLVSGTLDANGFNVTAAAISFANTANITLTMGSGTFTLSGAGNVWNMNSTTLPTINANTSTILLTSASASAVTFLGGNRTWNNLTFSSGGAGVASIFNTNTFNVLTINAPKTFQFTATTTQTVSRFECRGSIGNTISLASSVAASAGTISSAFYMHQLDYLTIQDVTATGASKWYAGWHSTNVSGNTGWQLQAGTTNFNSAGSMLGVG